MIRFLLAFVLFFGAFTQASGQGGMDTLGLTGTIADTAVAKQMLATARKLNEKGSFDETVNVIDQARNIIINTVGKNTVLYGDVMHIGGWAYSNLGLHEKAIDYYNESLSARTSTFGEVHHKIGQLYTNLGFCYIDLYKYDKALIYLNKSKDILSKIYGEKHINVTYPLNSIGIIYRKTGNPEKAIGIFLELMDCYNEKEPENYLSIGAAYGNLSHCYEDLGDYGSAIRQILNAINFFNKAPVNDYEKNHFLSIAYGSLASKYFALNDFQKASRALEKSIAILVKNGTAQNSNLAHPYGNLGATYLEMKRYEEAYKLLKKSLEMRLAISQEENVNISEIYKLMGSYFIETGMTDSALIYYKRSLNIRRKNLGLYNSDVAISCINVGYAYSKLKNIDSSIFYYTQALESFRAIYGEKHYRLALCYRNLGNQYSYKGKLIEADSFFTKALEVLDFQSADNEIKLNLLSEIIGVLESQSTFYFNTYIQTNNISYLYKGKSSFSNLINCVKAHYIRIESNDSKVAIIDNQIPYIEKNINTTLTLSLNKEFTNEIFDLSEFTKSSILRESIRASSAIIYANIPDSIIIMESSIKQRILHYEKKLYEMQIINKKSIEDTSVITINNHLFELNNQREVLLNSVEDLYPDYYRLKYDLSTVSLAYVQDTLLQKDQALLEYFTGDSSLFLFVVRPDTFLVQEVKRDFPLEAWIDSLRFGLYGYYTTDKSQRTDSLREAALNSYIRYAQLLQQKLIAPVAAWLPEKVILVPDGPLGYIPFDALLSTEPEDRNNFKSYPYLLQKHQFSYTYSATLLREMRDKKHRREPQYDFAAFAPFYNGDTTLLAGMYAYDDLMRKDLQPLAFSGPEVAAAAKLMKGETIAGPAATEERFTSTAGNYRILHLATHGRADNRVGDYAFLAFNEIKDSIENELLYVKDLYNLQLNADLVVLSACETGIGKLQRGEGIISLARAFAYAGAKSIVTSLWSVNDKSTSELMRFFYRELRRGKDKDEALRLARQRLIREATVRNSHPFFWAAFVPLGDMRRVK